MRGLILKSLYLLALLKHPGIRKKHRYYLRDNYFSRLFQVKYLFRDYLGKKKYKVIEYYGEFQQELTFVLPFAYWHHLNGTLDKTISCKSTRELYFFSPDHEEKHEQRDWEYDAKKFEVPNMTHSLTFSFSKWKRVPLKEKYSNDVFRFAKPVLVIANKFNIEWNQAPLNFLSVPVLEKIIASLGNKYQIIYNRPLSSRIVSDNSDILDLDEYGWLREKHPEVILLEDLYLQHKSPANNFNHLQLMVYANCSHFISVHGGTAALASYFGGTNIVLSKSGVEHSFNEFSTIFPALSGARVLHARSEEDVFHYLDEYY